MIVVRDCSRAAELQSAMRFGCIAGFILMVAFAGFGLAGCGPVVTPSFDSPEPAARNAAIVQAAETRDKGSVGDLVKMLDSDDPATRVLAIRTLERITGETLGYDPHADATARAIATRKWHAWQDAQGVDGGRK